MECHFYPSPIHLGALYKNKTKQNKSRAFPELGGSHLISGPKENNGSGFVWVTHPTPRRGYSHPGCCYSFPRSCFGRTHQLLIGKGWQEREVLVQPSHGEAAGHEVRGERTRRSGQAFPSRRGLLGPPRSLSQLCWELQFQAEDGRELVYVTGPDLLSQRLFPNFTVTILPLLEGFQILSLKFIVFQFLLDMIELCL